MKKFRVICIKRLEKNVDGKLITAYPGSIWVLENSSYWAGENVLTNENKPEWRITVSDYVYELCFKPLVSKHEA